MYVYTFQGHISIKPKTNFKVSLHFVLECFFCPLKYTLIEICISDSNGSEVHRIVRAVSNIVFGILYVNRLLSFFGTY